jgi:hypothetical protein
VRPPSPKPGKYASCWQSRLLCIATRIASLHTIECCVPGESRSRQLDRIVFDSHRAGLSTLDTALIDFALKLAADAPSVSGKDIEALREHGFADKAILEAILATALSNFLSTLSVGLGASPDVEPLAIPAGHRAPTKERAYVGSTAGPYLRTVELSPDTFPPFAFFLKRFGFIPA